MVRPNSTEYPAFYETYIRLIPGNELLYFLRNQINYVNETFINISEEKALYRYAPDKWSIKEVLQHIIDAERIFGYRILSIARGEKSPLVSFEQDQYVENSHSDQQEWKSLVKAFINLRQSTIDLIESLNDADLAKSGTIGGNSVSAASFAYIIGGHAAHHFSIYKERYGV